MGDAIDARGALHRLDELAGPVSLDPTVEPFDAYVYALGKMAERAMRAEALDDALRLHYLRDELERARERGDAVEIPRSDALRLSAQLHAYRERLLERGDVAGVRDVEQAIHVVDGELESTPGVRGER